VVEAVPPVPFPLRRLVPDVAGQKSVPDVAAENPPSPLPFRIELPEVAGA
jgi:hypothetical protein